MERLNMKRLIIFLTIAGLCGMVVWPALVQGQREDGYFSQANKNRVKARKFLGERGVDLDQVSTRLSEQDDIGTAHVRFDQRIDGVRVFGYELITHENSRGEFSDLSGRVFRGRAGATRPVYDATDAVELAAAQFGTYTDAEYELVIYPRSSGVHLAWSIDIRNTDEVNYAPRREHYMLDAITGMTLDHWDNLQTAAATGTGYGYYAGTVSAFPIDLTSGNYTMFDVPNNSKTTDYANKTCGLFGCGNKVGTIYSSTASTFGTTGALSDRASIGVDAHYFANRTLAYWLSTFNRNGIDNANNKNLKYKYMLSRTHYGTNYNNAFWDGSSMNYGDGDGATYRPFDAVDVVGHEMMHGVTERTSNLTYSNESGAANESFSDINGVLIEFFLGTVNGFGGVSYPADWWMGEDLYFSNNPSNPTRGIRNMADPHIEGDPCHYSEKITTTSDNGGVHTNSGIMNKVFYLLAVGGTNHKDVQLNPSSFTTVTGIGSSDAGKVSFDADTKYCTSSSNYQAVANAWVSAAKNRFGAGSVQAQQAFNAWKACGRTPTVTP